MKQWSLASIALRVMLAVALCSAAVALAAPDTLKLDAELIWGTNAAKSPDPKHKPVDADLAKRLAQSPFKWKNYFEVKRLHEEISGTQTKELKMSDHCVLHIRSLGGNRVEIKLQGDGKPVSTHTETLQDDWPLILSGNAKNDTAWMVVIEKTPDKPRAK